MGRSKTRGFWRGEVWGRRKQLLKDPALWLSLLAGIATALIAPKIPLGSMKIEVLANYAILFATLSFGASIAGAGIALGVPGNARVQRWSTIIPKGAQHSAFQNLLFIFAWSAMVQIGLVLVSFLAIAYGTGYSISPRGVEPIDALPHYSSAFFSFWIWWYALFELTAVVRTFMQVAGAIVKENVMKVDASPCSSTAQNDPVDGVCQSPEKPGLILPDGSKYHEVH